MSEQPTMPPPADAGVDELHVLMARHNLLSLFEHLTFRQRVTKVLRGLKAPKDSGDYKYARLQVARLAAPISAILVPAAMVVALSFLAAMQPERAREIVVQVIDPETIEDLDIMLDMDEPIEPPDPIDLDFTPDVTVPTEMTSVINAPQTELSPATASFNEVAVVRSPVIMRGIVGNRSGAMRGKAIAEFGGSGFTEGAVLRALRWLKSTQNPDGSWNNNKPAMTSFALLAFLAHGETPASEEFGSTVQRAIQFLVQSAGSSMIIGGNYEIPIVTYALTEAYALTRIPMLKPIVELNIDRIIKGQHATGGWDYSLRPGDRDDTSYMAWCVQALKAAELAGINHPDLENAKRLAVTGFKNNAHPEGGFGYTGPGQGGLTSAGVLSMQFLGASREAETRRGLQYLVQNATMNWREPWGRSPVYYWYYNTQAKFHAGGSTWSRWNDMFSRELVANQTVLRGAGEDGKDLGYWDSPSEHEHTGGNPRIMDTCLCALQLQVYYRYLPTFRTPTDIEDDKDFVEIDEIQIEITI